MNTGSRTYWKLYFDGGSRGNPGPSAAAFVAYDESGKKIAEEARLLGKTTNNIAEYSALLLALEFLEKHDAKRIILCTDSKLVYSQVRGLWKVKNEKIVTLCREARHRLQQYEAVDLRLVSREENKEADKLVNQVLDSKDPEADIPFADILEHDSPQQLDFD